MTHKTGDVFGVTRDLPITYAERKHVDDRLLDNLTRDKHVIIFGSSKQGKTCLRRHCLQENDYILVQCQNAWDIAKLSEAILKAAGCEVEISNSRTSEGRSKLEVKATGGFSLLGLGKTEIQGGSEGERTDSQSRSFEPLELDPSDPNDLVRALRGIDFAKFIVLEDFHYLPQETQEQFAFALKTVHEISRITFIVVAVWREENRLIVYNGDLAGRVISVDVDEWSRDDLLKVICAGESLLNVQFPREFKEDLITRALHSVYIVQDCCYKACREHNVAETRDKHFAFPDELDAEKLVRAVSRPFCNGARHQASRCVDRRLAPIGCEVGPVQDRRCAVRPGHHCDHRRMKRRAIGLIARIEGGAQARWKGGQANSPSKITANRVIRLMSTCEATFCG